MILVFGGTTEGRKAVEVLDEAGQAYYYSTKTGEQDLTSHHGIRIDGAMDHEAMTAFCHDHGIRLIVDAAHPFAAALHLTIHDVAEAMHLPVIRYERIYPPRSSDITWLDDYDDIPHDIHSLLATTGVQSIGRLKHLEQEGIRLFYRILPRESSIRIAHQQGATDDQLCFYEDSKTIDFQADAILLKESGLSGGFEEKVDAARKKGMRILVLKRPSLPQGFIQVDGPHGLRRMIEKWLPEFYPLHSGLTTGTCATAAAIAAACQWAGRGTPDEVAVLLPDGETISVNVTYGDGFASVFKEAGDDPDVTDGLEIRAMVRPAETFGILGGKGVGIITLPGFDYPPGSPAINKVPREMIRNNLSRQHFSTPFLVTISVPDGEEIARKTFNPRLGIEGGISIIGVSGIVKPFSEEAFIDSIRKCMTIAKASGAQRVVINSGGKSERFVHARYPDLPQQAFVEYGNYIGETLRIAHELDIREVTLGVMLGKAVKLAAGFLDTHSRRSTMDKTFIAGMLNEAHCPVDISGIALARELWQMIPEASVADFARTVISHCHRHCDPLLPNGKLTILLIDEAGRIYP